MKANLVVDSFDDIVSELKLYKLAGGGTLCDVTPNSMRCPQQQLEISVHKLESVN